MRPITKITAPLLVALLVVVPATDATAQRAPLGSGRASAFELPPDAIAHIVGGDQLIAEWKYGAARKEYEAAAALLESRGSLAVVPLRRIAESLYFEGRYQTAVYTLDRLAETAAGNGDTVTQIWALADAAWVLGEDYKRRPRGGAKLELKSRIAQLRTLAASPYLPEDVRAEVAAKRLEGCCLALGSETSVRLARHAPGK